MEFANWLSQNGIVKTDYSTLKKSFIEAKENLIDYVASRQNHVSNFNINKFQTDLNNFNIYPQKQQLVNAVNSKNQDAIFDQYSKLVKWSSTLNTGMFSQYLAIVREIRLYIDWLDKDDFNIENTARELDVSINDALQETQKFFTQKVEPSIEGAINRINWGGSPVIIEPIAPMEHGRPSIGPSNWASIHVGSQNTFFSFGFDNGKPEIDEVLEADEADMFPSDQVKFDYFNLINELRNPGSTKKGRILTLYTARPRKDRDFYLNTQSLPINIFLTDNPSDVEGISMEYGGERDIWRVRIDSKYLTQTLDGRIKHYQVTSPDATVRSIDLL